MVYAIKISEQLTVETIIAYSLYKAIIPMSDRDVVKEHIIMNNKTETTAVGVKHQLQTV